MKKIAVVILNWNGRQFLETFMPSVTTYSIGEGVEVIVADNGSTDQSVEFLEKVYPTVKIIRFEKNYGYAQGYNLALQQLEHDYFILLNSDVEVTENWIQPVIKKMEANKNVAAAMPKIRSYYDKTSFEYAGAAGGFLDRNGYSFCRGRIFEYIEKDLAQYNQEIPVFWATGACLFIRASVYKECGGLDAYFFAHWEEIDLCWRIKNKGYEIMCYPESIIYHAGGGTLPYNNPRKVFLNFRNNLFTLYKNAPADKLGSILINRFFLDTLAAFRFLTSLKFQSSLAVFRAYIKFFMKRKMYREYRENAPAKDLLFKEMYQGNIIFQYWFNRKKKYSDIFNKL